MNKLLLMQLQMKRCVRIYALRLTAFRGTKSESQHISKVKVRGRDILNKNTLRMYASQLIFDIIAKHFSIRINRNKENLL